MTVELVFSTIIPLIFVIGFFLKKNNCYNNQSISQALCLSYLLLLALVMAQSDYSIDSDKARYSSFFAYIETFGDGDLITIKDFGWSIYAQIIKKIGANVDAFFIVTSFIYCLSYYLFSRKIIRKEYVYFLVICSTGFLGFWGYGVNTIRNGFALGLCLIALSRNNKYSKILIFMVAILCHKSVALIVVAYYMSIHLRNCKYYVYFWIICFIVSALGFSLLSYADFFEDERLSSFSEWSRDNYQIGFRIDFILYSVIPAFIAYYNIKKTMAKDQVYCQLFNMYLVINAFWLLVIRMAFTNRIAYLSWFLIPFLLIYPYSNAIRLTVRRKFFMTMILLMFIILNLILYLE